MHKILILLLSMAALYNLKGAEPSFLEPTPDNSYRPKIMERLKSEDKKAFRILYTDSENDKISGKEPKINKQNFYGKTPLFEACEHGRIAVVQFLLKEFNADITIADDRGG